MSKLLLATTSVAALLALSAPMASAQTGSSIGPDSILCSDVTDLDRESAREVIYFVAGYKAGQQSGGSFSPDTGSLGSGTGSMESDTGSTASGGALGSSSAGSSLEGSSADPSSNLGTADTSAGTGSEGTLSSDSQAEPSDPGSAAAEAMSGAAGSSSAAEGDDDSSRVLASLGGKPIDFDAVMSDCSSESTQPVAAILERQN